jgi:hypothetical protein
MNTSGTMDTSGTIDIILFNDVCIFDGNKTIIYGQYNNKFTSIKLNYNFKVIFCENRDDFYIEIYEKVYYIDNITFVNDQYINVIKKDIILKFPFENCNLSLDSNSVIISTMCKDYSSRLEEWINYNLNLGFSGIVIFDNDENKSNEINEPLEYRQNNGTISDICKKYKNKVFHIKYNYQPMCKNHYDTIQRISLHIGVNAFRNKCSKIALIDADEFIHIPNKSNKSNIIDFLSNYKGQTITMKSNILTNKLNDDIINNNILDICIYVGENKYTKTIIDTNQIKPMEFIITPHRHPEQILLDKNILMYYHCWVNSRYEYNTNMQKIDLSLKNYVDN